MSVDLTEIDAGLARLEQMMSERHGMKFKIMRNADASEISVTARHSVQKTAVIRNLERLDRPRDVVDSIFDACINARLALCSDIQGWMLMLPDQERDAEARAFVNAAYYYRLACMELQPAWERLKKCPKGSAAAEIAYREFEELKKAAADKRVALVRLAAGPHQEQVE